MLRPDEGAVFPRFRTGRTAPCIEYLRRAAQPSIRPVSPSHRNQPDSPAKRRRPRSISEEKMKRLKLALAASLLAGSLAGRRPRTCRPHVLDAGSGALCPRRVVVEPSQ